MTNAEYKGDQAERHVSSDEPSDYLLLWRYRSGSQEAAREIYLRYAERLRALARLKCTPTLARRVDADDIVQSVFGTFFDGASRGRYDIPDGEDLWKLFLILALNRIRAEFVFHQAAKRDTRRTATLDGFLASSLRQGHLDGTDEGFLKLVAEEALECLPEQHRCVVELRLKGHEVAEIATQIGRSKRSVERILQQSRDKLNVLLREQ